MVESQRWPIIAQGDSLRLLTPATKYELIESVLTFLNVDEARCVNPSVDEIIMHSGGIVATKFLDDRQLIEYALKQVCADDGKLCAGKIRRALVPGLIAQIGESDLMAFIDKNKDQLRRCTPSNCSPAQAEVSGIELVDGLNKWLEAKGLQTSIPDLSLLSGKAFLGLGKNGQF